MKKSVVVKALAVILTMAPTVWADTLAANESPVQEAVVAAENVAFAPGTQTELAVKPAEEGGRIVIAQAELPATPGGKATETKVASPEEKEEALSEEVEDTAIADPIEPFNRVMFQFNDKLYYWFMKPVAQGYAFVAPEDIRVSVRNFFDNVTMPVRLVNCLLQGKFGSAGTELSRFGINTVLGFGGFIDTAKRGFDISAKNEDLGQTLGYYGMPPLMYIVWPFLGPSSVRDTIGIAGDSFLNPINYIPPIEIQFGLHGYNQLNRTSLAIGEYEDIVEASVEPYIAIRDAFVQNRQKAIRE